MKLKPKVSDKTVPVHIFKAGRHTSMEGKTLVFSEAMLSQIARDYDAKKHEAPIVIGHPEHDAPAYGWVKSLTVNKNGLYANVHRLNPQFAEKVRAGAYGKVSASLYAPHSPNNPKRGRWGLRHVGFLGAQPPAVKGLDVVSLSDAEIGVWTFEENAQAAASDEGKATGVLKRLKAWLKENLGEDVAEDVLPEDKVEQLTQDAPEDALDDGAAEAIDSDTPAEEVVEELAHQVVEQAETIAELTAENEALQEQLEAEQDEESKSQAEAFAERMVEEGRVLPRHRAAVVAFMEVAGGKRPRRSKSGVVEFGEGEKARPLLPAFKAFVASLPPVANFSEVAPKHRAAPRKPDVNPLLADAERRAGKSAQ